MANNLTVIKQATLVYGSSSLSVQIGDTIAPSSPFYYEALRSGIAIDSSVPAGSTFVPTVVLTDLEKQRTRQDSDRRQKLPVTTEPSSVTVSVTADGTLTKSYYIDVSGQTNGTSVVASANQLNSVPFDFGTPAFLKQLSKSGGNVTGFVFNSPSKDPNVIPSPANNFAVQELRVLTNAPKIAFTLFRIIGANVMGHYVCINGQPVALRPVIGAGAADFVFVTFPDSQLREISLRTTAGIGALYVAPTYDIYKPTTPRGGLSLYTIGDSYSAATVYNDAATANGLQDESLPAGIEDFLGIDEHYIDGISGTSWVTRAAGGLQGPNNNYQDRWPQVLRANPDVLFVPNGAANDCYNVVDPTLTVAAVAACFRQLRAQNKNTKFIWADGFTPPLGNFATNGARYTALRAMLQTALMDVGVYYISTFDWMYGAGYGPSNKNSVSNTDWMIGADSTHGTALGYRSLKQRLARKVRRILVDDGTLLNTVI